MIKLDLYRYTGLVTKKHFIHYLLASPGFKFTFFYRLCAKYSRKSIIGFIAYQF
jgi:serine O-acetyltransferase